MMNNELTTIQRQLAVPVSPQTTLLEMRMSPERFPRVGRVTREVAVLEMTKTIHQAYLLRGQTTDTATIEFIASNLVDELQADFDHKNTGCISFAEISRIIKRKILTDEVYGISVASLYKIIIEYIDGEGAKLTEQARQTRTQKAVNLGGQDLTPMIDAFTGQMLKNAKL